uniref:4-diphosphocytidyl-2-C-methyl-D-erythritol kinase n=1 Tax=Fervidobacterium thailandense TaxID=1008305 RepID=A0A7C4RVG5_9BACT
MGKGRSYLLRTYAKINLCLDVLFKRIDGFHEIDSLFQNVSLYDEMEVKITHGQGRIFVESDTQIEENILYKVWNLSKSFEYDCYVKLKKNIPMGAGLGGGSSNAGAFLTLLAVTGVISQERKNEIAPLVGSDVPFFLHGGTAIVGGRGELIKRVTPLSGFRVDIFKPNFSISTKEAYSKLNSKLFGKAPLKAVELYNAFKQHDLTAIQRGVYNIFESVIPDVLRTEIEMYRKDYPAALTGSGSAYFVIKDAGYYEFVDKACEIVEN